MRPMEANMSDEQNKPEKKKKTAITTYAVAELKYAFSSRFSIALIFSYLPCRQNFE